MISIEKQNAISLACYRSVSTMFSFFCNPQNRGPNFAWSEFPSMMHERWPPHIVKVHFPSRYPNEVEEFFRQTLDHVADSMVRSAGF
jgi:hypothetical protein